MRAIKKKPYVLVPPAPYPLPGQGSHSRRRGHAKSSTLTRDERQPTVNRPEQRMGPSQPPTPLPELSKALTELTAQSIADEVVDKLFLLLVSNYFDLFFKMVD